MMKTKTEIIAMIKKASSLLDQAEDAILEQTDEWKNDDGEELVLFHEDYLLSAMSNLYEIIG
tara:strand:+ start:641 stop:826 length:186 start_codon:yes stop_codon:yes gene_type:complete